MKQPRGKILSVANKKGGCGKTTLATNLAVMFAREGREVLVIDADPQQKSTMNWCANRMENGKDLPFIQSSCLPSNNLRKNAEHLRPKYDVIIVDGGAGVTEHAKAACAVADFLLVPVKASGVDVNATAGFLEEVVLEMEHREDLRVGLLLNELNERTVQGRSIVEQVYGWDNFATFEKRVGSYQAFRDALTLGMGVVEYAPRNVASRQMEEFFDELKGALHGW